VAEDWQLELFSQTNPHWFAGGALRELIGKHKPLRQPFPFQSSESEPFPDRRERRRGGMRVSSPSTAATDTVATAATAATAAAIATTATLATAIGMLAGTAAIAVRFGLNIYANILANIPVSILANIHANILAHILANIPVSILANHHQHAHRLAKLFVGACKRQASPNFRPLPQLVLDNQR
jgi:hypothetical protein